MNLNEKNIRLLKRMALEYRLSLKNICKIIGVEFNSKNEQIILNDVLKFKSTQEEIKYFSNLIGETNCESIKNERISYQSALLFILKLKKAELSGDKEKVIEVLKLLKKTDYNFIIAKKNISSKKISIEDIIAISKYRIKYGLSRRELSEIIKYDDSLLLQKEKLIDSDYIKGKLEKLKEYQLDKVVHNYRYCKNRK